MKRPWLPSKYPIAEDVIRGKLIYAGECWQIYKSIDESKNILLITNTLFDQLSAKGFVTSALWDELSLGKNRYKLLISDMLVIPVAEYVDAGDLTALIGVAKALVRTRELDNEVTLQDSIYVEQYSLLLPTFVETVSVKDEVILGRIITGGVSVSAGNIAEVNKYCNWLDPEDLVMLAKTSGIEIIEPTEDSKIKSASKESIEGAEAPFKPKGKFRLSGRPELENFFNDYIIDILQKPEQYAKMGIEFPSATILYGPPGCGKTYAVEQLVKFLGIPSFTIDSNSIASPYIHQTSKLIADVFTKAMDLAPSVVVIDEMEAFVADRREVHQQHSREEVAEFLRLIPKAIQNKVLVIAMTNHLDMIDPAVRRTGRFDHIIEVGYPSEEEILSLLNYLLSKRPASKDLNVKQLAGRLVGKSLSDTDFIIREAAMWAAKNGKECIDQDCINAAMEKLPTSDTEEHRPIGFR